MTAGAVSAGAVSAGAERPLRRDAAENRQRLLDAAAQVFAEHGLDAGVEEIARVAGVGMGTLYRRFPSKDALIAALVRDVLDTLLTLADEACLRTDGSGLEYFLESASAYQAAHRGCLPR
jgi:AcrR family transcriptional regulator